MTEQPIRAMHVETVGAACAGCGACVSACPKRAIRMRPNAEGFLYPAIDADLCVHCGLCEKTCPALSPVAARAPRRARAAKCRDDGVRMQSSSGGVFTCLARAVLARGGVVFGAVLRAEDFRAEIRMAQTEAELLPMRGSKYVQSDMTGAFAPAKQALKDGREVLFTGCPCQVAAMRAYLGDDQPNLYTAEILCHGVPSPLLFETYARYLGQKEGAPVRAYAFRTKRHGWGMECEYQTDKGRRARKTCADPYGCAFQAGSIYRESCYACPFARLARVGDLVLGDYWGVVREHPAFYSEKGVSAVLETTPKGAALLARAADGLEMIDTEPEKIARHNLNLVRPTPRPAARDGIYEGLNQLPPAEYVRARLKVKNSPGTLLKAYLPWQIKKLLSGVLK